MPDSFFIFALELAAKPLLLMNWIVLKNHAWEIVFYLFCLAAFIQVFYYSFFYSRVAFFKKKKRHQSQQHPVSVIICARDEDENIARHLPGVLVQKYSSTHEVIVVNDNSVDDSKYILEELQKTFKFLQIVDLKQEAKLISGKKYPLSIGIKEAKHEIFLRNKGFSSINHIPGGDDDLFINKVATKHNTSVVIDKDAITLSQPKGSFGEWLRQKTRHYSTARYYKKGNKFLLAIYSLSQFFFYPLLVLAALFYSWQLSLIVFGVRFVLQSCIFFKAMKKLNEADLWPWFLFFDIWMFVYYIIFAPSLWKKPRVSWN